MFPVGPLLTVLRLLTGGATAVSACDILLFLGLGLHLAIVSVAALTTTTETYAVLQYLLKIVVHVAR